MRTSSSRSRAFRLEDGETLSVHDYMERANRCYYARQKVFGRSGDFITAPEISQVFGELVGLWAAVTWRQMGAPERLILAEPGPGRGTLMADALRAAKQVMPEFVEAARLHLVETSPALRHEQDTRLAEHDPAWLDHLRDLPPGPALIIANEFLDALPIRQYQRTETGWRERMVVSRKGKLSFWLGDVVEPKDLAPAHRAAPTGAIVEVCPQARTLVFDLAQRLAQDGGAALFIDYGPMRSAPGDSLQAVRNHTFHPVLDNPGKADITAHVDFQSLAARARAGGARVHGPVEQGVWLRRLGVEQRTALLARGQTPERAALLFSACERLIAPREMGRLFKVLGLTDPVLPTPAGFEA